jgi:uncharacterized protein
VSVSPADRTSGPSRGTLILGGLAASIVLPAIVGGAFLAGTNYDTTTETGVGAYVGRVGAQTQILGVEPSPLGLPLWAITLLQIPLWIGLLGAVWLAAGRRVEGLRDRLGFVVLPRDIPSGLAVGIATQIVLVPLLYALIFWLIGDRDVSTEARALTDRADSVSGIVLLLVGVGLIAPVVEELFFRGLVLPTFESRIGAFAALVASSALFAFIHFQVLQFPALMLFGLIAGAMAQRQGRLGGAVWTHIGFNMVTLLLLLFVA